MIKIEILEPDDLIKSTDWCRPLYNSVLTNKWVRVSEYIDPKWVDKRTRDYCYQQGKRYEFLRGTPLSTHSIGVEE